MDSSKKHTRKNPKGSANPISKLFFFWLRGLFWKGLKKDLQQDDLFNTLKVDDSDKLGSKLEKHWNEELKRAHSKDQKPSLWRAIIKTFWGWYLFYGLIMLFNFIVLKVAQPLFLSKLLQFFSPKNIWSNPLYPNPDFLNITKDQAYTYAGGVAGVGFLMPFLIHQYAMGTFFIAMRLRVACCSLMYRKVLRLNKAAMGQTATGQIVNLMSNDVARFDHAAFNFTFLFITPAQIIVISYFLWQIVQESSLIGLGFIFIQTLPVQALVGSMTSKLRMRIALRTDERVRLMSEIISGIQVIKMYAWEKPFALLVAAARKREIDVVTKTSYLRGLYLSFMIFSERSALFATLTAYVLLGNEISAYKVFALASFFNLLNQTMAIYFPTGVALTLETNVSIQRIQKFLLSEELPPPPEKDQSIGAVGLTMTNACAKWTTDSAEDTLKSVNLRVEPGQLCSIIGQVGAGKSSLLHAILGELSLSSGTFKFGGQVSYASQEPWLFVGSVRNNILFGQEYDAKKYRQIVKVCALQRDMELFPYGDQTIVGERGVSLSGGQRARINLARAVYKEADVYLLDDPLSAVDAHVGKHMFEECIKGYLKYKTVILVTHQLHLLKNSNIIVVFANGTVVKQGSFKDVMESGDDFAKLLEAQDEVVEDERRSSAASSRKITPSHTPSPLRQRSGTVTSKASTTAESMDYAVQDTVEESRTTGTVTWSSYSSYFTEGGSSCFLFTVVAMLLIGQVATSGADYWASFWTRQAEKCALLGDANCNPLFTQDMYYMIVYGSIVLACTVITLTRSMLFFKMCMRASIGLHNTMFSKILQATMYFFDTNPSGRILNRFSKDMGSVDELLPKALIEATQVLLVMTGVMVLIIISNYWLIIPIAVLGLLFFLMRIMYLATARNVKRLEGITRSPVFSHLSASLDGLTTIRANDAQEMVRVEFDDHQNLHTSSWFLFVATGTAFGFYLDVLSAIFSAVVSFSFLLISSAAGPSVGLAISQSLQMTGILQYGIRQSAEVVSQMTSVERVLEYTHIAKEPQNDTRPPAKWPTRGEIRFNNMSLKYSPDDPAVLKNLNFTIQSKHKVGIVGRTGAGKSSLIAALFRLANQEGEILIDDVDTQTLGLMHLRSSIAIIPQEPVLFSASIRDNLDPFNQYEDNQLWNALEEVELKEAMGSLDFHVNEGGSNFSVGQRQLVCLARAILRNNKVLVLDEATANVDPQTDALIQGTIRRRFAECTVLTIAHRLNTIMDSDRVIVMDAGRMVEYDHPHKLLQKKADGKLWSMVQETGPAMADQLAAVALKAYNSTHMTNIDNKRSAELETFMEGVQQTDSVNVTSTSADVGPKTTVTASNAAGDALPSSTANIMPPPTADVMPPPTADVMPPPTADVMPPPTADIMPPPTADVMPPPTTDIMPPPTADVMPPPTADIVPPPTANIVPVTNADNVSQTVVDMEQKTTGADILPVTEESNLSKSTSAAGDDDDDVVTAM